MQLVLGLHHCHNPDERERETGQLSLVPPSGSNSNPGLYRRDSVLDEAKAREARLRGKLEALDIPVPGIVPSIGNKSSGATGQVLHRDLKPENSEHSRFLTSR